MQKGVTFAPKIALFVGAVAAGAILLSKRQRAIVDPAVLDEMKKGLAELRQHLEAQETTTASRLAQIDSRLDEHASKLADVPSMTQLTTAMEQLLSKTVAPLDRLLTTQAASIEVLQTTVSETDKLLERVIESLDVLSAPHDDLPNSQ